MPTSDTWQVMSCVGAGVTEETIDDAADYIAQRMTEIGLDTTAVDGQPFQSVQIPVGARAGAIKNNFASFDFQSGDSGQPARIEAKLDQDMNPLTLGAQSGSGEGPVVFVGYGITAPKLGYDDYAGVDVQGKTVMMLRKEPRLNDPRSPFDGEKNSRHAYFVNKIKNAIKHKAAGVILVNDPESVLKDVQDQRSKIAKETERKERIEKELERLPPEAKNSRASFEKKLENTVNMISRLEDDLQQAKRGLMGVSDAGGAPIKDAVPVFSLARDTAEQLIQRSIGKTLPEIEKQIDRTTKPYSRLLSGVQSTWKVELKSSSADSKNVIGVLPGRGKLAEQTVVVGAHYDHVGMGGFGSLAPGTVAVHNGADDNASGTAAMLSTAGIVKDRLQEFESHRRVVFIAFTGEERGLVGSKEYVQQPSFPIENTTTMVNLDMVGRLRDNELTLYGTGSAEALDEIIERSNASFGFDLFKVKTGYGPSDHQSFYKAGVPVLFFFTGLHNDYHRPTDDADKIEYEGTARITQMVADVTLRFAVRPERLKYAETENRVRIRRQLTAFMGVSLSDRGTYVLLSAVNENGPGAKAGLRMNDRLDVIEKQKIRNSNQVLEILRTRSPGQTIKVRVHRGGRPVEIPVKLGKRPAGQ